MRIFIRRKVSEDNIDLLTLKPLERIVVSLTNAYHNLNIYQQKLREEELKEYTIRLEKEEVLKNAILFNIHKYFSNNKKSKSIKSITLSIPRESKDILDGIIKSKDLVSFNCEYVNIDSDYLLSFPQIPILVKFTRKNIDGGES